MIGVETIHATSKNTSKKHKTDSETCQNSIYKH